MTDDRIIELAVLSGLVSHEADCGRVVCTYQEGANIKADLIRFAHALLREQDTGEPE